MKDGVSSSETLHQGGFLRFLHLDFVSPPKPVRGKLLDQLIPSLESKTSFLPISPLHAYQYLLLFLADNPFDDM